MIVCVDIGGGTTRIGFSHNGENFSRIERFGTKDDFDEETNQIIQRIKKEMLPIKKIVFAVAGSVDRKRGTVISWGQKRTWWGKSIFEPFVSEFPNTTLLLENDGNLAALGEAVYGAGKMYSLIGLVTMGSGIGGGLVHDRTIVPHVFGIEPAHQIVNREETRMWSCGQKGCFESYASGTAFQKMFGMSAEACVDKRIWEQYAKFLSTGLANLIALWSPEVMILGGGVSNKFDSFIGPLRTELARLLPMYQLPVITKAELPESGLYGGLIYEGV